MLINEFCKILYITFRILFHLRMLFIIYRNTYEITLLLNFTLKLLELKLIFPILSPVCIYWNTKFYASARARYVL